MGPLTKPVSCVLDRCSLLALTVVAVNAWQELEVRAGSGECALEGRDEGCRYIPYNRSAVQQLAQPQPGRFTAVHGRSAEMFIVLL